jgi:nuclear pore complex protein Nup133
VQSIFQAADRYRSETSSLYHLDFDHISFDAWTCQMSNIKLLQRQFQMSLDVLQDRKVSSLDQMGAREDRADENASQQQMLRGQLCDLAKCILDLYEERVAFLQVAGGTNPALEKEGLLLQEDFRSARSNVILSLVDVNRADRAFVLAEKHKDFHVLTLLCSSLKGNARVIRIRSYLDKYQHAFAFELYEHYIQTGAIAKLLDEEEDYHPLLSEFLQSNEGYNRIAWLHEINLKQWGQASQRLQEEANSEARRIQDKKLMLSLCKLSYVAQLREQDVASIVEQERIEVVDDQLDIINVHQKIREELRGNTAQRLQVDFEDALEASTEILGETSPAFKEVRYD